MGKCAHTFVQLTYSLLPRDRATERYSLQMRQKKCWKASIDPEVYRQQVLAAMSAGCLQRMFYMDRSPPGGQYIAKKRPSGIVILRCAQDDNAESAAFDSQNVLCE